MKGRTFIGISWLLVCVSACMLIAADRNQAVAQVISATAVYDRGVLTVRGATAQGGSFVSLNRGLIQRSNSLGRFVFRQTTLPQLCSVNLRSAGRVYRTNIRNCPFRARVNRLGVDKAIYEAGVLTVAGRTAKPNQMITLDGIFRERSDDQRRYKFRI